MALPFLFEFWAMEHQLPPTGAWRSWVVMGGRGAGKTRAGAEWVRAEVEGARPLDPGRARRVALVGETEAQVREVMIFGESGIMACSPPDRRPEWRATRKLLEWPNGATAQVFSAQEPEALRGPQFDAAWADEYGCAAVDKGTNQPNRFLDPKSSESSLPKYSDGRRDELIQMQYLRAMIEFWNAPENNPASDIYDGSMVDMSNAHVWAWDARPFPFFPMNGNIWSDGSNYHRGHWINGRTTSRSLADVVEEICERSGVAPVDTSRLYGYVRGYSVANVRDARSALQPLMLAYGFEAIERDGMLVFQTRNGHLKTSVDVDQLAFSTEIAGDIERIRAPDAEVVGRLQLSFIDAIGDYDIRAEEALFPDESAQVTSKSEVPLLLTKTEGRAIVERWLAEARVARDMVRFAMPMSALGVVAGDVIDFPSTGNEGRYRVDRLAHAGFQTVEAVRIEAETYRHSDEAEAPGIVRPFAVPAPVFSTFMDLPLLSGEESEVAPHIAVSATPWPGSVAVYSSATESGFKLNRLIQSQSIIGFTDSPLLRATPMILDRGPALRVNLLNGQLSSAFLDAVLNGANTAAIGDGSPENWEVFQFTDAVLVDEDIYEISGRLRGQAGTDAIGSLDWPPGSTFVMLDGGPQQIALKSSERGLDRFYRIGPAQQALDDESFTEIVQSFNGIGLRPYAPVHLRAAKDGTGNITFSWVRRTRIDGDSWQSVEVPIGEDREAYVVRILKNGLVLREIERLVPSWTYSPALQSADGATSGFTMQVAQISNRYGVGPFRRIDINV